MKIRLILETLLDKSSSVVSTGTYFNIGKQFYNATELKTHTILSVVTDRVTIGKYVAIKLC